MPVGQGFGGGAIWSKLSYHAQERTVTSSSCVRAVLLNLKEILAMHAEALLSRFLGYMASIGWWRSRERHLDGSCICQGGVPGCVAVMLGLRRVPSIAYHELLQRLRNGTLLLFMCPEVAQKSLSFGFTTVDDINPALRE